MQSESATEPAAGVARLALAEQGLEVARLQHQRALGVRERPLLVENVVRCAPDQVLVYSKKGVRLAQKDASWLVYFCGNTAVKG